MVARKHRESKGLETKYILQLGMVVMHIIPVLRRLRQEDHEFEASLGHIVRPCPQKTKKRYTLKAMLLVTYFLQLGPTSY
jgi:hypothetical protein